MLYSSARYYETVLMNLAFLKNIFYSIVWRLSTGGWFVCHEPRRRDHLSVAWKIPGSAFEAPIPDSRLSPLYSSASFAGKISGSNTFADEMKSNGENVLKVAVTPNPSSSYFTLEISSDSKKPLSVRVMDAAGRIVDTKLNAASKSILQVGGQLQSGIYFVEILQGSEKEMLKLVKQ